MGDGTRFSRANSAAMVMSFSSNASLNVRGKARVITRSVNRFCDTFDRPLDALLTSSASRGEMPAFDNVTRPSLSAQM